MPRITFTISGDYENRGEHWAARNKEFRITTYGLTTEEADGRMMKAIDLLLDEMLRNGISSLQEQLKRRGISFEYSEYFESDESIPFNRTFARELALA